MEPDLELGLEIMADVLLHATLPAEVIEREKLVQAATIKSEDEHMTSLARNLLRANLFGSHPYGMRESGTLESVASIDRTQLLDFQRQHIVARNGVVAVFGNIKAETVRERLEALLAGLPAGEATSPEAELPPPVPAQNGGHP